MNDMENSEPRREKTDLGLDSHAGGSKALGAETKQRRVLDTVVKISNLAWTTVANVAVGVFVGHWLDKRLGTQPFFLVIFSILGIIAAILYIFSFSRKISGSKQKDKE